MKPHEYTRNQMADAAKKLQEVKAIPCCETPSYEIRPEVSLLTSRNSNSELGSMDMLSVLCRNCGIIRQYDPTVLGI